MPPLLTVCTIAYNQEKFIAQTLEGIVMQRANFKFEAIIGDDCSTDNTAKIIAKYAEKYPALIKPVFREKNIGMAANSFDVLFRATGKYIALCEGDDYWTDPLKLQKQVDFLEANQDYSICFHPVEILTVDGKMSSDFRTKNVPETTSIYDLAGKPYYIRPVSLVLRNNPDLIRDFVSLKCAVGDYVLYLLFAQYGKIKMLPDVMAVYRQGVGVMNSRTPEYWYTTWYRDWGLLCDYFKDKNKIVHLELVRKKNQVVTGYLNFLFQSKNEEGAVKFLDVMDHDSKSNLLRYFLKAESSLADIYSSRGWRVLQKLYGFRDAVMPVGSRRWRYVERTLKFIYRLMG